MSDVTGVILAGGSASRMGQDKAFVRFRGAAMVTHVAASLTAAGLDVIVVGRGEPLNGLRAVPDDGVSGRGPMAGMVTGLRTAGTDIFLVAVDQPLLRPETITAILRLPGDAVVPRADGHPQVTCALYRQSCLEPAVTSLATGELKLRRMLDKVATNYIEPDVWSDWGEDGRSWLSLDTPDAVAAAEVHIATE